MKEKRMQGSVDIVKAFKWILLQVWNVYDLESILLYHETFLNWIGIKKLIIKGLKTLANGMKIAKLLGFFTSSKS